MVDSDDSPDDSPSRDSQTPDDRPDPVDDTDRTKLAASRLSRPGSPFDSSALQSRSRPDSDSIPFEPNGNSPSDGEDEREPVDESTDDSDSPDPSVDTQTGTDAIEATADTTAREYIEITPVRSELSPQTITNQLRGLHAMGNGRELPLSLEENLSFVDPINTFEFLIHKPAGEQRFNFYLGIDRNDDLEQLQSKTTSQYPSNYRFDTEEVALSECFEETPHLCRWDGKSQKRHDWMMLLSQFNEDSAERSPFSDLLETAVATEEEWVFQAVFEPRADWTRKAENQKRNLKMGVTSGVGFFVQTMLDRLVGVSEHEQRSRHRNDIPAEEIGSAEQGANDKSRHTASRMAQLNNKEPQTSFNLTLRCASPDKNVVENATGAFNQQSGSFYRLEGQYLGQDNAEYQRLLDHDLTRPTPIEAFWKRQPMLVVTASELANFVTVPTIDSLPKASRGASGGGPATHSPLTTPDEEVFQSYNEGMCIGKAVTPTDSDTSDSSHEGIESVAEWRSEINQRKAIQLNSETLTRHYLRVGTTGSGKTISGINDLLSAQDELQGPTFLLDSKGGEMCDNYLRSHRYIFDDLDDVEYIKIPGDDEEVLGLPFFDIRPLVHYSNMSRKSAIQQKTDHFFEILRYILDDGVADQSKFGNLLLRAFMRTLFDENRADYPDPDQASFGDEAWVGGDAFPISDFYNMATAYESERIIPDFPSDAGNNWEQPFRQHIHKGDQQFNRIAGSVTNRVGALLKYDFIWQMLDYKPEWDHDRGWYADDANVLDFRELLHSNKVVIIDTGELRDEASQMFNVLFLSHLWTAAKYFPKPSHEEYVINCHIEESAPLAQSDIVCNKFLPKGRDYDLSLGLVMQFPEQVAGGNQSDDQPYKEILNNTHTKVIGNIPNDDELPESLFHEKLDTDEIADQIRGLSDGRYIAQLPSTEFEGERPEIMTVAPVSLPPGHGETSTAIRPKTDAVWENTRKKYCITPDQTADRLIDNETDTTRGSPADTSGDGADTDGPRSAEELSDQERTFLQDVIGYWNDDLPFYDRGDPMATREFDRRGLADTLVDDEFLREVKLANRYTYYWPTNKALAVFDDFEIVWGTEQGDPRESPRHKVIVSLLERIYSNRGFSVKTYIGGDDTSGTFDLIATHPQKDHRVIEVETSRPDRPESPLREDDVIEDYEKLAEFCEANDAMALWVLESQKAAHHLLDILEEDGHVADHPSRNTQGYGKITEQTDAGPGLDKVTGFGIILDRTVGESRYEDPDSSSVQ